MPIRVSIPATLAFARTAAPQNQVPRKILVAGNRQTAHLLRVEFRPEVPAEEVGR